MSLFVVSLGGKVLGGNLEVHDVRFVIADTIDETIPLVKEAWFGIETKLHLDSYLTLSHVDGYKIELTNHNINDNMAPKLYCVHFGGYRPEWSQEIHRLGFYVATSENEAKERARFDGESFEIQGHVDAVIDVSKQLMNVSNEKTSIKLEPISVSEFPKAHQNYFKPDWYGYRRLDLE